MEEILNSHPEVVESAVISHRDDIKGEVPVGFIVTKKDSHDDHIRLEKELIKLVRQEIGPVAVFKKCAVVNRLPKTRSGKILRNLLRDIVDGKECRIPGTIEDESVVAEVIEICKEHDLI